jgi:tetratricopeptide (TPR) repeat protein
MNPCSLIPYIFAANLKNMLNRLPLIITVLLCFAFLTPPGSQKRAYKYFFRGTISYEEGLFKDASRQFGKAYEIVPQNYSIALSYAVSLAQAGDFQKAIKIFLRCGNLFNKLDPEYEQKKATLAYSGGLIYCYAKDYNLAARYFRQSLNRQIKLGNTKLIGALYNALAYAQFMNQSSNSYDKGDINRHFHITESDMKKAVETLKASLKFNPGNPVARKNLKLMTDSLGIKYPLVFDSTAMLQRRAEQAYISLPQDVYNSIDFQNFDEVVFMLDISGSMVMENVVCMGKTRFEVMRETVLHLLRNIDPMVKIGIGTIGGDCGTEPRLWVSAEEKTRKELIWDIQFLVPDGTTPLLNILKSSTALFSPSDSTRRGIFLVSDGANICKAEGLDICEWATQVGQQGTAINILTFLDAQLNNVNAFAEYGCLAENTFGEIHYIDNLYCKLQAFSFDMVDRFAPEFPEFERVYCFGKNRKLWAVFGEN